MKHDVAGDLPPIRNLQPDVLVGDVSVVLDAVRASTQRLVDQLALTETRLEAELLLAALLGELTDQADEFLELADDDAPDQGLGFVGVEVPPILATHVIDLCVRAATPVTLGALRLMASLGGSGTREEAAKAVVLLLEGALEAPIWAGEDASLTVVRAWQSSYRGDPLITLGILFADGEGEHAVSIEVDTSEDARVVEISVAVGPEARQIPAELARNSNPKSFTVPHFEELDQKVALALLREALGGEVMPWESRSAETRGLLHLVRARADAISAVLNEPPVDLFDDLLLNRIHSDEDDFPGRWIYQVRVTLEGSSPEIWRRLEIPDGMYLELLHDVLQAAFDWDGSHPHRFVLYQDRKWRALSQSRPMVTRVSSLLKRPGSKLRYVYDFGDEWTHVVVLEKRVAREDGVVYPRCTGGEMAAPPEDSGGVFGYARLLAALGDEEHPEHAWAIEWSEPIDAQNVDKDRIDARLTAVVAGEYFEDDLDFEEFEAD